MQKTILQVPMNKRLRNDAEKAASEQGFSSLQELIRVFLAKLASNKLEVNLQESFILSPKNEARYIKMTENFKSGRDINSAGDTDDLLMKLDED